MRLFWVLAGLAGLATTVAVAQSSSRPAQGFRSGIEVTSITATVTDADGHPVTDLPREAFTVFDDGERQEVTQFTSDRVPLSLGVLLDTSDSMFGQRMADARGAVEAFLFEQLTPTDEFFVMAFNHAPRLLSGWTSSRPVIVDALAGIRPTGGTALHDAVLAALPLIDARAHRRASLVVISDGADTASTATVRELRTGLHRSDALVYAIAIDSPSRHAINTRVDVPALVSLTAETGGRVETVHDTRDLAAATARISAELSQQYVLGYTSPRGNDGRFHSLRLRVNRPGLTVRARKGYIAG